MRNKLNFNGEILGRHGKYFNFLHVDLHYFIFDVDKYAPDLLLAGQNEISPIRGLSACENCKVNSLIC